MKKSGAAGLVRFGVAMEGELLSRFEQLIASRGWENRSEALRRASRRDRDPRRRDRLQVAGRADGAASRRDAGVETARGAEG